MSVHVRIDRIEVGGWTPPHELKIELIGTIDTPVDDSIVIAGQLYGREFLDAAGPTIEEAFERCILGRKVFAGVDLAAEPAVIEDIEL